MGSSFSVRKYNFKEMSIKRGWRRGQSKKISKRNKHAMLSESDISSGDENYMQPNDDASANITNTNIANECQPVELKSRGLAELASEEYFVSCPNKRVGCKKNLKYLDYRLHVSQCDYRRVDCPLNAEGKCFWFGSLKVLPEHFVKHHHKKETLTCVTTYK